MPPVVPVINREAYVVGYELCGDIILVHVRVRKWSTNIGRQFRRDIDAAHEALGLPVHVVVPDDRPLLPKFLRLHGFEPHGTVLNLAGHERPFFIRHPPHGKQHDHAIEHGHQLHVAVDPPG